MDALSPVLADAAIFPYHSGNTLVDVVLFVVWGFVFGFAFTLGQRVCSKLL